MILHPIGVVTRTPDGTDEYGDTTYVETFTVVGGVYAPGASTELVQGQDTIIDQPTVYLPAGTAITALDVVIPDVVVDGDWQPITDSRGQPQGTRCQVDGDPVVWPASPFTGWTPALPVVARLERVTG